MRATLWQGTSEASEIVREILRAAVFGLAGIPLDVVDSSEELLAAVAYTRRSSDHDILVIDCFDGTSDDIQRCIPIVTGTPLTVHIVHPREDVVRELEQAAGRSLVWLPSDMTIKFLLDKLNVLRGLIAVEAAQDARLILKNREREVLRLLAERYTDAQIAQQLDVSESTVKTTVRALKDGLGVETRPDLREMYRRWSRGTN